MLRVMNAARVALLVAGVLFFGAASAEVRLRVLESFPAAPATLGHWEQYYLRIGYVADQPIRVRVDPYFGAAEVPGMNGGSPLHAAGAGEALFWIAYTKPARVDRLVVYAQDEKWQGRFAELELPVALAWTGEKPATAQALPDWVLRLRAEREARDKLESQARMNAPASWGWTAAFFVMGWSIPLYFILQAVLLWRWRGGWRLAAAIPAVPMAAVLLHAVYAYFRGSNIFPLFLIFFCPVALAYLVVLLGVRRARVGAFVREPPGAAR
jgi:hypothetical protein